MLVQLVHTLVGAGSREKCRFQWLSEQGQRCWRTDCFRNVTPQPPVVSLLIIVYCVIDPYFTQVTEAIKSVCSIDIA